MSNRQSVLASLKKHGQSTYEDLEFSTGINRAQLRQAVNDAKKAGHLIAGSDITGQQDYTITEAGEEWIKYMPVEPGEAKGNSVVKQSLTTEKLKDDALDIAVRNHNLLMSISIALGLDGDAVIAELPERIMSMREELGDRQELIMSMREELGDRQELIDALIKEATLISLNLEFIEGSNLPEKVCQVMHERIHDKERIAQLEQMKVAEITSQQPTGFVVSAPKQPIRRFKNNATAKAQAMSFARNFGTGEVFAIYPAGKAVRGAEWRE